MKIIIVGCGKVGGTLAKQLCSEGHDVTVLDKDASKLRAMSSGYDVLALEGDASSYSDLKEAGVEDADILIAVTDSDEKNLLCCLIGRKTGNLKAIARVRNPVYNSEVEFFRKGFGLAMVINPEMAAASEIARMFRFPSAINIETFAKGHIELLTFHLPEHSKLAGKPLTYIHSKLHTDVLVVMVKRGDQVTIPSGDFVVQAGDVLSIVTGHGQAHDFFGKIGIETNRVNNVMIVGGGKGDGIDEDLLLEEGIEVVDGFTALTGLDEQNIMIGLFAKSVSKSNVKLVTKITKISFDDVIAGLNLGSIVNPKEITADYILQFVRSMQASVGSEMENLYKLPDSNAEAMEFHIGEQCRACDIPLQKLRLKKNILIAKIYRGDHLFTPTGSDYMQVGDTVVLVALREHKITNLDDILES